MEPARSVSLGGLVAVLVGSLLWIEFALRLSLFPPGNQPRAALWFSGIVVASVFVLPSLWDGRRLGYAGSAFVGGWVLASLLVLPALFTGTGSLEVLLLLAPYALAALALLLTGWQGWRAAA